MAQRNCKDMIRRNRMLTLLSLLIVGLLSSLAFTASADDCGLSGEATALPEATPCADDLVGELVPVWGYDAGTPDELARWVSYGLADMQKWQVIGTGDEAYFQGTSDGALLHSYGFPIHNVLTFNFQDEEYVVYDVPMEDGTSRPLALVQTGRRESQFVDPSNPDGDLITWAGSWRTLVPAADPSIAVEFSARVRLGMPQSELLLYVASFNGQAAVLDLRDGAMAAGMVNMFPPQSDISDITPLLTPIDAPFAAQEWHTVRLRVQGDRLRVYVDEALAADIAHDGFVSDSTVLAGLMTSAIPATVSLDDLAVTTNDPNFEP
jgi:hypothetical protein